MIQGGNFLLLGIQGEALNADEIKLIQELQPAGFILFSRNIISPDQTRALTSSIRQYYDDEPIIAMDQEGGRVARTQAFAKAAPAASALAERAYIPDIIQASRATANLLQLLGINLNLAPVLDLDHFPKLQNALGGRSWGRNPQRVIDYAGWWNRTHLKSQMLTCAKHFPAGGRAQLDPHHDLPSSSCSLSDLLKEDIIPYTALMSELHAVMIGHVDFPEIDPDLPASLSPIMVQKILRHQLGFDHHLVMTDDLDMGAIQQRYGTKEASKLAILAGNDLAMICHQTSVAYEAAEAISTISSYHLEDAFLRIQRFKKRLSAPAIWSSQIWQQTLNTLDQLHLSYPTDSQNSSLVTTY